MFHPLYRTFATGSFVTVLQNFLTSEEELRVALILMAFFGGPRAHGGPRIAFRCFGVIFRHGSAVRTVLQTEIASIFLIRFRVQ
jgi:hypothetical protein